MEYERSVLELLPSRVLTEGLAMIRYPCLHCHKTFDGPVRSPGKPLICPHCDTPRPSRDVVAYHEAGHAVLRARLPGKHRNLKEVRIDHATDDTGKPCYGCTVPEKPANDQQRGDWTVDIGSVLIALAGSVAEEKYAGQFDKTHASSDFNNASAIVQQAAGCLDNDSPLVDGIVNATREQCKYMFDNEPGFWKEVVAVAEALVKRGRLDCREVQELRCIVRCGE